MLININDDTALNMLMERVEYWTDDDTTYHLFELMYERHIFGGYFDGGDFDVMAIVDNDYVNWCSVISESDDVYEDIKRLYDENGLDDISCESNNHGWNFIEAEYNGSFLVRY